uniref:Pre-SET domain-containing protein n=1 Tax=Ascaris lumbricoides TaxID=6252 RepID=A0A0M3IVL2_ASCLU
MTSSSDRLACCCVDNCQSHCPCVSRCVYDSSGRLTDKVREMAEKQELGVILECNASCFCSSQCPSRVAQNGVRSHLEVYRSRRYGWAVRSAVPIQKGEFISEYTGELISGEEADKREDDTYLFEIVVGEFISEYTGELISGEEADKREDDTYLFEIVNAYPVD